MKDFTELITSIQIENILRRVQYTLEYYESEINRVRKEDQVEFPMISEENNDPILKEKVNG